MFNQSLIRSIYLPLSKSSGRLPMVEQCRYKYKTAKKADKKVNKYKFVAMRDRYSASEVAREYFDTHYPKVVGFKKWPSVRCAMLSRKKYGCVVNNYYENVEEYEEKLVQSGAVNIIAELQKIAEEQIKAIKQELVVIKRKAENFNELELAKAEEQIEKLNEYLSDYDDLILSSVNIKLYAQPRGVYTELEDPLKSGEAILPGFLLDAASCLPVLLLNLRPNDMILDMCASPGGKLNTILQSVGSFGHIVANDVDKQRVRRLKNVIRQYLPKGSSANIKVVNYDGRHWSDIETSCYSKVLVDVPCTNDRLSMYNQERDSDSIFSKYRKRERNNLPRVQASLLKNAILACRPGGTVVYSTCAISPLQNDFIVDYVLLELREELGVEARSHDLTCFKRSLAPHFNFNKFDRVEEHGHVVRRHGTLVVPSLDCNFGPMYMSKITRLS